MSSAFCDIYLKKSIILLGKILLSLAIPLLYLILILIRSKEITVSFDSLLRQCDFIQVFFRIKKTSVIPEIILPGVESEDNIWHQFILRNKNRDEVLLKLKDSVIPSNLSEAYADMGVKQGDFFIAEEIADTFLCLPIGPHMPGCGCQTGGHYHCQKYRPEFVAVFIPCI